MRTLILAFCLIASICAYHTQHNFNIQYENTEYVFPKTYNLAEKFQNVPLEPLTGVLSEISKNLRKQPTAGTEAILNDYADKIFANLETFLMHAGLDPFEMPEIHTGFSYHLIITYHGQLDLTHGWLNDISTMHRGGDVVVSYSTSAKYLQVTVPIAFDDLQFTYDYHADIMGLGPNGGTYGKVSNVGARVKIGFNSVTLQASLDEFYITNSGHISLHFTGNPLIDWLVNLLSEVASTVLKEAILLIVESIIRGGLDSVVEIINNFIDGFINPTTPIPTTTLAALFAN